MRVDALKSGSCETLDLSHRDHLAGIVNVHKVMANPFALLKRWFSDTDVQVPVHIAGICIDDFSVESEGKIDGCRGLANAGRSEDRHDGWQ